MDELETMIHNSSIPESESMQALHVFSILPADTREKLLAYFKTYTDMLELFWESYKMKLNALTKKDTALWTSILETEREQIEMAAE